MAVSATSISAIKDKINDKKEEIEGNQSQLDDINEQMEGYEGELDVLAEQMDDELSCCAALLHDVVEDSNVTLEELSKIFPAEVIEAVALMTHRKDADYLEYVAAIRENPIARAVKLADIAHNSDTTRLEATADNLATQKRLHEKYSKALQILK